MIATIDEIKKNSKLAKIDDNLLENKLKAIETFIRGNYTNNKFYNRHIKFHCNSINNRLLTDNPFLKVGDTIEIAESPNEGLYTIKSIEDGTITLDRYVFDFYNYVIKVEYPEDVKQGALDMLEWEFGAKEKVGLKSETISRHSVTYEDSANFVSGYPISILGFLEPYKKMRV
ncbi:MAG: hypothetical protein MJ231_07320 [bacterium]|nr:hypothetical protein [bacterium]